MPITKLRPPQQIAVVPNLQPTCKYQDCRARSQRSRIGQEDPHRGYRDSQRATGSGAAWIQGSGRGLRRSNQILYEPAPHRESDNRKVPANPDKDRAFHARNTYAIVMRVLARFERALGRRVGWSFLGHQLTVAPHAFLDLNAYYSKDDHAIFFGYYPGESGTVLTCLSHEVIAHETTHALVDGLRPDYMYPSSPDQAAFHEGFADIVALLSVLSLREVVTAALDLHTSKEQELIRASALTEKAFKEGVLFGLAQQVGEAMYGTHGVALRQVHRT